MGKSTLQWPKILITNIFFKTMQLSTSKKPILKDVFIYYT